MIRVVYRWRVKLHLIDTFVEAWWEATRCIQQTSPGARGSVLLRSHSDPDVYIAVARWDSLAAWQANRERDPSVVPAEVTAAMKATMAAPTTVEIFDEIRDWPADDDAPARAP